MRSFRGSAQVEAALIIPLVVLIVAGMIRLGFGLCEKVEVSSAQNSTTAHSLAGGGLLPEESVLRGKWHIK